MPGGARTHRKINHLRGKDKCSQDAQQRNLIFVQAALRPPCQIYDRRRGRYIERGPHRSRKKSIGDVHDLYTVARSVKSCHRRRDGVHSTLNTGFPAVTQRKP
jgi:hypothetical protein